MRTIQTIATIDADNRLTIELPPNLPTGEYQVVIVIEEPPPPKRPFSINDLPTDDLGPWPENLSLRREDMYDDWGR
jgi:hypothetical protein